MADQSPSEAFDRWSEPWGEAMHRKSLPDALAVLDAELARVDVSPEMIVCMLLFKSQTYERFQDYDSALSYAFQSQAVLDNGGAWGQIGRLMVKTGHLTAARSCFENELATSKRSLILPVVYPTSVICAYIHLMEVERQLGNLGKAHEWLRQALEYSPDKPDLMLEHAQQRLGL